MYVIDGTVSITPLVLYSTPPEHQQKYIIIIMLELYYAVLQCINIELATN